MEEKELQEIERKCAVNDKSATDDVYDLANECRALIAEVRKLQKDVARYEADIGNALVNPAAGPAIQRH